VADWFLTPDERGNPVVGDVEAVFRERWEDPQPLSRNPVHWIADRLRGDDRARRTLPPQLPDPPAAGTHTVQLLRTYPRRLGGYRFAPRGERSVARGDLKAFGRARRLVYLEDQYLWSLEAASALAAILRARPQLRLIAVLPHYPDQDGRVSRPPNLVGREDALALLRAAGGDRVAAYGVENPAGIPVYVHAAAASPRSARTGSVLGRRRRERPPAPPSPPIKAHVSSSVSAGPVAAASA